MVDVPENRRAALAEWLIGAAVAIEIQRDSSLPGAPGCDTHPFRVEVTNGRTGQDAAAAIVARCASEMDAELVAAGLWALMRESSDQRTGRRRGVEYTTEQAISTLSDEGHTRADIVAALGSLIDAGLDLPDTPEGERRISAADLAVLRAQLRSGQ